MPSISEKEPMIGTESPSITEKEPRVTVTGLDEKGQMFRESALVIELSGRNCHFRSKFQPDLGSWVLVEFDLPNSDSKRTTVQGQVKSAQPELSAANMYRVQVELETAQDLKNTGPAQSAKVATTAPPLVPAPAPVCWPTSL